MEMKSSTPAISTNISFIINILLTVFNVVEWHSVRNGFAC
jgi:hypothetical protein